MNSVMKSKFGVILFVICICASATFGLGRIVDDRFYYMGQFFTLIGTLGLGGAFASLGIFVFANAERFMKGTIIPLFSTLPPKIGAIIIGVQFMVLAAIMVYQAISTLKNIVFQ